MIAGNPMGKIATAKLQLHRLVELKGENVASWIRQQAAYYLKGIPRAAKTKAKVNEVETEQAVGDILDRFVEETEARIAE